MRLMLLSSGRHPSGESGLMSSPNQERRHGTALPLVLLPSVLDRIHNEISWEMVWEMPTDMSYSKLTRLDIYGENGTGAWPGFCGGILHPSHLPCLEVLHLRFLSLQALGSFFPPVFTSTEGPSATARPRSPTMPNLKRLVIQNHSSMEEEEEGAANLLPRIVHHAPHLQLLRWIGK
jgi:hypothetical protein